jgi:hypothetical protein
MALHVISLSGGAYNNLLYKCEVAKLGSKAGIYFLEREGEGGGGETERKRESEREIDRQRKRE